VPQIDEWLFVMGRIETARRRAGGPEDIGHRVTRGAAP